MPPPLVIPIRFTSANRALSRFVGKSPALNSRPNARLSVTLSINRTLHLGIRQHLLGLTHRALGRWNVFGRGSCSALAKRARAPSSAAAFDAVDLARRSRFIQREQASGLAYTVSGFRTAAVTHAETNNLRRVSEVASTSPTLATTCCELDVGRSRRRDRRFPLWDAYPNEIIARIAATVATIEELFSHD